MDRKIKILFAVGRFSVGGAEKFLVNQVAALDREKFAPSVVTIFSEQKDTFADKVHIDRCFHFRSTYDAGAFIRLFWYIRGERLDVVVTHLFSANLLVRIVAILARVPVIVSYEHNIYPQKHRWQIFMDRLLSRWTDRIITDSEVARQFTSKQESIPLEKFITLHIPPLLDRKEPKDATEIRRDLGIAADARIVLTVSRLVTDKGHRYLVEAAKEVLARVAGTVFVIVGWGPCEGELRAQVANYGLERQVILPGRMDIQDMLPLADVYVDPALSTDLPIAIMEAMREGKAIVATSVGDIPLFVEDGKTGLIVPPGDAPMLIEKIERLLKDTALRNTLGAAARIKVQDFSLKKYMKTFEDIIYGLVRKS